jgi:predicted MFS family arabinose efflux permease
VILTLAAVLALDGADKGSVGAMAEPLQQAFHIGKTDFGLLLTVSLGTAAGATFVFGSFVDRANRVRLLAWTTAGWAAAIALSAFATSYVFLLLSRIALGAITASAAPAIASLIGDYFPTQERGGVYSSVLGGEVLGSGAGFLLSGELANWTWRAAFGALAILAVVLARVVHALPEPRRGGGGSFTSRRQKHQSSSSSKQIVRESRSSPRPELVLKENPSQRSLWWVLGYVLRIPTNRVLIVASALAYFYFTGLRAFGVEYLRSWLRVGHSAAVILMVLAGSGALVGVLISGRSADRLLARGCANARILVACIAYFATTGLFALSLLTRAIGLELPLLVLAAAALGAISPPLDAARLDIMHPSLWGRAESVRTCLRKAAEAAAPISFGYVAEHVYGDATGGAGLHATFFLMLIALAVGGGVGLLALRSYPRDVATVVASRTS